MNTAILIVNSIAALFAVIGAAIAIVVYRKTAKLQRNAIGYSMLDDRIKILKYFEHDYDQDPIKALYKQMLGGRDWEIEKFKLLFSEKLVKEYDALIEYSQKSGDLESKIASLEQDYLSTRRDGESLNNDGHIRYASVNYQRNKILKAEKALSTDDLEAFKRLCQQSFPKEKWQEYYDSVCNLLERDKEYKKMHSSFMEHLHHELKTSVSEVKKGMKFKFKIRRNNHSLRRRRH